MVELRKKPAAFDLSVSVRVYVISVVSINFAHNSILGHKLNNFQTIVFSSG